MIPLVALMIFGKLPRKSNSRRVVRFGTRPALIKSQDALNYEKSFIHQVPGEARIGYPGDVVLRATIYYPSRRSDLSDELLCDLMEKAGIIVDDRQVKHKCLSWALDKENPRVEAKLYRAEEWRCGNA